MTALVALIRAQRLATLAAVFAALSFVLPLGFSAKGQALHWPNVAGPFVFACCGLFTALLAVLRPPRRLAPVLGFALLGALAALAPLILLATDVAAALDAATWRSGFWCYTFALACLGVTTVRRLAALEPGGGFSAALSAYGTPLLFGAWVIVLWQLLVRAFDVPQVLLPAPSAVWRALWASFGVLAGDFEQTVLHAVLIGLVAGSALGFVVGVLIDRSAFLQRGLLPLAALASTVPLVGIAPIMVMWFGFDWHSKAAVVVVMTFFPMLVNTLAGLAGHWSLKRHTAGGHVDNLTGEFAPICQHVTAEQVDLHALMAPAFLGKRQNNRFGQWQCHSCRGRKAFIFRS